jgi:quercetin dioxygenase-like cupin family protein
MKKMMNWVMIVTLICGSAALMNACKKSNTPDCCQQATEQTEQTEAEDSVKQVVSTELIRTSQSWDGVELPDYFEGRPELVAVKYVFPAGKKLGWHHHVVMNYGVLVQGELTIIGQDGKTKVVHEGEPVVEMVGTIHHGENRGTKDCILYMFYLSQKDLPLAVQHPEIPLE